MKLLYPFLAVLALIVVGLIGGQIVGLRFLLGVILPYLAFGFFIVMFAYRIVQWAKVPVPFRIPTTCGQEASLSWIKPDRLESPSNKLEVVGRMILEILLFRSLFRNTKAEVHDGPKLAYGSAKWLWLFALIFHYSFLVIVLRHLRLFLEPVPGFVQSLEFMDGIFEIGVPTMYMTDVLLPLALIFLFLRRVMGRHLRYLSLAADYFPLFLIFAIAITGILTRFAFRTDIAAVKELTVGLTAFSPTLADSINPFVFVHILLVCTLLVYFPLSKLMHMGGVFMSPTRNMINNSRTVRHINPWNDPNIKPHPYEAYEDEFRDFMKDAGLPLEKE
ncbi:MAG: sulfate reduction electron transfer complex DsrMKJOP subunit DsrM [Thermodesulfobacteriota bacterium]